MMSNGQSPTPNTVKATQRKDFSFPGAIAAVIRGERITKAEWDNLAIYGELREGKLMIKLEDGWHIWELSDGDLLGEDWTVL
jgi:hypothetical protein